MTDLRTVLIDIRQSMLYIHDGFPAEKNSPGFIAACQKIVEHGWDNKLNDDGRFDFIKRLSDTPLKRYFTRLCLLKLIYEETVIDRNVVNDKNWFREMRNKLNTEFSELIKKSTDRKIMIGDREIRTLADLEDVRHQARATIQQRNNFRPIVYGVGLVYFVSRVTNARVLALCLSVFVIAASLYYLQLQGSSLSAGGTLFQAHRAERHLQQPNPNIMDNANIKKFFLLNDAELNKVENPSPKPN